VPWTDIRDATSFGPRAPQLESVLGNALEEFGEPLGEAAGEDCLRLNVWTPSADDAHRPVLVYLHGGGWVMGSGAAPAYNGANLARRGDIVVVTINHRLGVFGFLHLEDVAGESYKGSGNAALLDIVAALQWVRANIARFGGDPARVTLAGQSGGGWKTSTLMALPAARALFQQAIIMSGPMLHAADRGRANRLTRATLDYLGISAADVAALHELPAEKILTAQAALPPPDVNAPYEFEPVVDGEILPWTQLEAYQRGEKPDIPMLIGSTRDEHTRTLHMVTNELSNYIADDDAARRLIRDLLGEHTDEVYAAYRELYPDISATDLYIALTSDLWARQPAIRIAEERVSHANAPVYMYLFSWPTPHFDGGLRATHGLDVPFALDNPDAASLTGDGTEARRMADAMSQAWVNFVRTGDPSHDGIGAWEPYTLERRQTMVFDHTSALVDDPLSPQRHVWEDVPEHLLGGYQIPGEFSNQ
jgi:para-nitrobenzyl esterase